MLELAAPKGAHFTAFAPSGMLMEQGLAPTLALTLTLTLTLTLALALTLSIAPSGMLMEQGRYDGAEQLLREAAEARPSGLGFETLSLSQA